MEIEYTLVHHPAVIADDMPRLDSYWRHEINNAVQAKLTTEPALFGKPLRQALVGHRVLRVGDYRVVYRIDKKLVKIIAIVHRSTKYKGVKRRI